MIPHPTEKATQKSAEPTLPSLTKCNSSPPLYYDSEPSSQPPRYTKGSKHPHGTASHHQRSSSQTPQTAGASAASVAAVLASPHVHADDDKEEKKSWRERWRDWKKSWEMESIYELDGGSSAHWNVRGARVDGRQNMRKALRR